MRVNANTRTLSDSPSRESMNGNRRRFPRRTREHAAARA